MQGYSIAGYLNAVIRRSERTILVEGVTDKKVLQRLKNERSAIVDRSLPGIVDVAGLLRDEEISGLGKKEIIKTVLSKIAGRPSMVLAVREKFGTLIDREWDGLTLDIEMSVPWFAPLQDHPNFVTVGHSVENYFFRLPVVTAFLRQFFSDSLNHDFFSSLARRFNSIIGFAVVYSIVMRDIDAIGRADRLISRNMTEWHGDRYLANEFLNQELLRRKIGFDRNIYLLINEGVRNYLEKHNAEEPGHWLCHGHLGEQAIWCCIASLAREHGVAADVAAQVERGLHDVRFRHCVDFLCRDGAHRHMPLDAAIEWLTN